MTHKIKFSLSGFYFSYFATIGIFLPYFNLYCAHLGFTGIQIGIISSVLPLTKVIFPSFWGYLSDRLQARKKILILDCFISTILFVFLFWVTDFYGMIIMIFIYSFFRAPIISLFEATTMQEVQTRKLDYGKIRVWGSIGFILLSTTLGKIIDYTSIKAVLHSVLVVSIINLIFSTQVPDTRPVPTQKGSPGLRKLLKRSDILIFFACAMLMQLSHGTYYGFFSIYMEEIGYSKTLIGILWSIGVVSEIVIMLISGKFLKRLGTIPIMTLSLALAALRWTLCSFVTSFPLLIIAQSLHAFTFAAFHIAAVTHTDNVFPAELKASGQALYSSLSFGLGGAIGLLGNGILFDSMGAPFLFFMSAVVSIIAVILSLLLKKKYHQSDSILHPTHYQEKNVADLM